MKNRNVFIAAALLSAAITACSGSRNEKADLEWQGAGRELSRADSMASLTSSSAAVESGKDTNRKFIRTAELKYKVKNVVKATYRVEDITVKFGGFVNYTKLASNINYTTLIPVSADSSLETTYYTIENTMVLRIPNTKLDTALKEMAPLIDFLDYRIIKADDIKLQMRSNMLREQRIRKHELRLENAIDNRGKKLGETNYAEENLLSRQLEADRATAANLELQDQVDFSTVNLSMYQRPSVKREVIGNDKNIEEYEPGFLAQITEAAHYGWNALMSIVIFLVKIWEVLLILGIVILMLRKYLAKKAKG